MRSRGLTDGTLMSNAFIEVVPSPHIIFDPLNHEFGRAFPRRRPGMDAEIVRRFVFADEPKIRRVGPLTLNEADWYHWYEVRGSAQKEPPVGCTLTTVYYAEGSRNAWGGSLWAGVYQDSFAFSFEATADWVSRNRKQGTSLVIKMRPAVVYTGDNLDLVVTAEHRMLRHAPQHVDRSSISTIAESFKKSGYRIFGKRSSYLPSKKRLAAFLPAIETSLRCPWTELARDDETLEMDQQLFQLLLRIEAEF